MSSNPKIWVLGDYETIADKTISWYESKFPYFADPDILIINLTTLDKNALDRIKIEDYRLIQKTLVDKFLHDGIIIVITTPNVIHHKTYDSHSNYDIIPISPIIQQITEGEEVVYNKDDKNPFLPYLKHVKKFNFYLEKFNLSKVQSSAVTVLGIKEIASYPDERITDKAGNILGETFSRRGSSGELVFLPPVTEISIKDGINKIIDSLRKSEPRVEESAPLWLSNVLATGVSEKQSYLKKLESQKQEVEEKIKSVNGEIQKLQSHRRLLYTNGSFLEESVYDAFKLLGFGEIKQIREKDKEDGVIDFHIKSDFKYGVIEVEGSDKRTSIEKLDQCNRWVNDHFLLGNDVKGIFISNQFRLKEYPKSKTERIHYEHNQLKYADTRKLCIIPSCVLFEAVNKALEGKAKSRTEIEKLIAETNGVLTAL